MKPFFPLVVAAGLCAGCFTVQGQAPDREPLGRVLGRMVAAGSGRPLPGVLVTLVSHSAVSGRRYSPTAVTREGGTFEFKGLAAGNYSFRCFKAGYGPNQDPTYSTYLGEDEFINDLVIELAPPGAITGIVFDPEGHPRPGIEVQAENTDTLFDDVSLEQRGNAKSNDEGRYHIFGLPAGRYFVRAVPTDAAETPLFSPTYYPGTTEFLAASRVRIDWGGEAAGIDIHLRPVYLTVVEGLLIDGESGSARGQRTVKVIEMAGPYLFLAETEEPARFVSMDVQVTADRPTGVRMSLAPGVTVSGRVRMENQDADNRKLPLSQDPYVRLSTLRPGFGGEKRDAPDEQGLFSLTDVPPDQYTLGSDCGVEGAYLTAAFLDGRKLPGRHIQIRAGVPIKDLEMVCSLSKALLRVTIKPSAGAARFDRLPGLNVWFRPDKADSRFLYLSLFGVSGLGGAPAEIDRIRPGRYTFYAIADSLAIEWADPEVLKVLEPYGAEVDLRAGETADVEMVFVPSSLRLP